ncbi:MAG: DciA family protein [bacterium]
MQTLGSFINKKSLVKRTIIDQQSVFYVFQLIIKEEYGKQGIENITPVFFKEKKIFIKASSSTWASEIWLRRGQIVARVNRELGGEEIVDLAMSQ